MSNIFSAVLAAFGRLPGVSLVAIAEKLPDILHALVALFAALAAVLTAVLPVVPENWKPGVEAAIAGLGAAGVWLAGKKLTSLVSFVVAAAERLEPSTSA